VSSNADPRALREMVKAAQQQDVPELDWNKLESKLFAQLDGDSARSSQGDEAAFSPVPDLEIETVGEEVRPSLLPGAVAAAVQLSPAPSRVSPIAERKNRFAWVGALAVAAAFVAVWFAREAPQQADIAVVSEPIDPMKVPAAPGMSGARDLAALDRGDVVEAALGPVAFGKLGVLEWTLAAGGRLAVRQALSSLENGVENQEIELESGSIASVVSAEHELVVVAGDTQVAMVGPATVSITRSSQLLVVDLKQGSASVGLRGDRGNVRMLSAPVRASFSLDGGLKFEIIPDAPVAAVEPVNAQRDVPPAVVADTTEQIPSEAATLNNGKRVNSDPLNNTPAATPGAEPVVAVLSDAAVSSTLMSCLRGVRAKEQTNSSADVTVSVVSTLKVETLADGSVKSASFSPPLRGDMQSCAVFLFRSKLSGGARVLSVPVSL